MGIINDSCVVTWDGGLNELQSMTENIPVIEAAIKFNSDGEHAVRSLCTVGFHTDMRGALE
jgi:hypothetical protein